MIYFIIGIILAVLYYTAVVVNIVFDFTNYGILTYGFIEYHEKPSDMAGALIPLGLCIALLIILIWPAIIFILITLGFIYIARYLIKHKPWNNI